MSFGATCALSDVSLRFEAGEVHVIAGANGAGKSTLIKIISGVHADYTGEVLLGGQPVRFKQPLAARRGGIATIHQELSLVPSLSIADNLLLSSPGAAWGFVSKASALARARGVLRQVGLELDPRLLVEELSLGERQLVEIARALAEEARVLLMDEPTSALSAPEVERLFSLVQELIKQNRSVIFISHRRDEVARIGQHMTVLRDGRVVLSAPSAEVSDDQVVRAMLGEAIDLPAKKSVALRGERAVALSARGLTASGVESLRDVDFTLHTHEILGVAGLVGSGAALLLSLLGGTARASSGTIELFGKPYRASDPRAALRAGVVQLPSERRHSVFPELSVTWNATLSGLAGLTRYGWVQREQELNAVRKYSQATHLKAHGAGALAGTLSGGNQQKVALMRCLVAAPRLLLLDDPTRGVDAKAKAEIGALLRELASEGVAVLLLSSELDELVTLCDRVLVFLGGRIEAQLAGAELHRERVLRAMLGAE
jgi:ribose transport system ATP-binding protein